MSLSVYQAGILREMGLAPLWRLRSTEALQTEPPPKTTQQNPPLVENPSPPPSSAKAIAEYLPQPPSPAAPEAAPAQEDSARMAQIASLEWDALTEHMQACGACTLCDARQQVVTGAGQTNAPWMVVGEMPGSQEDQQGLPFVGTSGRLLDKMLAQIGLARAENIYITNAVKCRPQHNRAPTDAELQACRPYLLRQIALQRPRLILALGRAAVQALLAQPLPINANRQRFFPLTLADGIESLVLLSYHPSYLLRNPADKARAWEDLCFFREQIERME